MPGSGLGTAKSRGQMLAWFSVCFGMNQASAAQAALGASEDWARQGRGVSTGTRYPEGHVLLRGADVVFAPSSPTLTQ